MYDDEEDDESRPMTWPEAAVKIIFILAFFGSLTTCAVFGLGSGGVH